MHNLVDWLLLYYFVYILRQQEAPMHNMADRLLLYYLLYIYFDNKRRQCIIWLIDYHSVIYCIYTGPSIVSYLPAAFFPRNARKKAKAIHGQWAARRAGRKLRRSADWNCFYEHKIWAGLLSMNNNHRSEQSLKFKLNTKYWNNKETEM